MKIDDNGIIRDMTPAEEARISFVEEPEISIEDRIAALMLEVEALKAEIKK